VRSSKFLRVFVGLSLLGVVSASAAPTLVQTTNTASSAKVKTLTATFATQPTAGNLLVAVNGIANANGGSLPGISGWYSAGAAPNFVPGGAMFWKVAGASEPLSVTVTNAESDTQGLAIYEYSGIALPAFMEGSFTTGSGSSLTSSVLTATSSSELIVGGFIVNANTSYTNWSNSFIERNEFKSGTVSTYARTANSGAWFGQFARFAASVVGPPGGLGNVYGYNTGRIILVDTTTGAGTTVRTISPGLLGAAGLAQRPSDGMIFFMDGAIGNDGVYRWDPYNPSSSPVFLGTTGVGIPYMPRWAFSTNNVLYAIDQFSGNLYTINQTTGAATPGPALTGGPSGGGDIAFAPDGKLYLVVGTTLYTVPIGGGPVTTNGAISGITGSVPGLAFDAAGRMLVCNGSNPAQVYVVDIPTRVATALPSTLGSDSGDLGSAPGIQGSFTVLSGTVFEDVNYGGGAGRSKAASSGVGRPNARVELYNASSNYVSSATTDASGNYSFTVTTNSTYKVRVVNNTVTSSRGGSGLVPVQTYRTDATNGVASVTDRVGGEVPLITDPGNGNSTLAALTTVTNAPQSITTVTVSSNSIAGLDFGFNFDTIVNTNDTAQGSLRQFIANANALSGADTSIFMISDGNAHAGLRAGIANQLNSGVARIALASVLPTLTDPDTAIDGGTQTANVGNSNAGTAGNPDKPGKSVGTGADGVENTGDEPQLPTYNNPEVEINGNNFGSAVLQIAGNNITVARVALYNHPSQSAGVLISGGTGGLVSGCYIGARADGTDPGAASI
jgi:hypothetical protein